MGRFPASLKRFEEDPRAEQVLRVWNSILHRDPTPREIGQFRLLGTMTLVDQAREIERKELGNKSEFALQELNASTQREFGVSLVSTYNRQCGIATYCENLYSALRKKIKANVLSDNSRDRAEQATEEGVCKCWSMGLEEYKVDLAREAVTNRNKIIHVQHEWGLYKDLDYFAKTMCFLKGFGFKTAATLHTVTDGRREKFLAPWFDVFIVHNESAAACLYGRGVNNVTVIPHGTEDPLDVNPQAAIDYISKNFIPLNPGDIFVSYPGFISPNKMQLEVLKAVKIACEKIPNLKFLLIGSHGIAGYDGGLLQKLKEFETDRIKVIQKFTTKEEMAKILTASDFCVQNYNTTAFSTSGMSHFLMAYGCPSVSSHARILEDLNSSMSLKVDGGNINAIADAVVRLAQDPGMRDQMSNSALSESIRTRWDKIADMHINVYKSIATR